MNRNYFILGTLLTGLLAAPAGAADPVPTLLSPGNYVVNVMPGFNHDMSTRIEKKLAAVPGVSAVSALTDDSSIHFTVKDKTQTNLVDIQKALEAIDKGAVMTTPVLAHTLSANPGL